MEGTSLPPPPDRRLPHLDFIDALRGYAILAVILYHCGQLVSDTYRWLAVPVSQGGLGVQLFFVVSAFTLFRSLHARASRDRRPIAAFFLRRLFRIVPLFWIGILFYVGHPDAWQPYFAPAGVSLIQVLLSLALLHGWYPTTFNSIVPGGWSIGVEAMFYLTLPFLFRRVRSLKNALWLLLGSSILTIVAIPLLTVAIMHFFPPEQSGLVRDFIASLFPIQLPVFCFGIVLYFLLDGSNSKFQRSKSNLAILLLSGTSLVLAPSHVTAGGLFTLITWCMATRPVRALVNPISTFVGKVSYSAYLWHFCILDQIASRMLPTLRPAWGPGALAGTQRLLTLYATVVAVTLAVAWLSYRLIELPFIKLGRNLIHSLKWNPTSLAPKVLLD